MESQNYKNHKRYVPTYHFFFFAVCLAIFVLSIISFFQCAISYSSSILFLLTSIALLILFYFARAFPLRAQDRAIRAEENLRHYILTGKLLDSKLRLSQVVALRFAPDEEFVPLCKLAVEQNLSSKQIKEKIINWKADNDRV